MAVDTELVDWLRAHRPEPEEASPFQSSAEVLAWSIACARAAGCDEVGEIETLLVAANFTRDELRADAKTLRKLNYTKVASLMSRLARRAKPRPPHWRDLGRAPAPVTMASPPLVPPSREAAKGLALLV